MIQKSTGLDRAAEPRLAPRVVTSIEEVMVARRAPKVFSGANVQAADQLLHAMRTVKAARFSAAERFERKHMLSLFSMSIVSLYFVGLSVWQAVYAPLLDDPTNRLVTLVSILSSIFTLVLALIESMNDYKIKALHMHACALAVNDLYHVQAAAAERQRARWWGIGAGLPPALQRGRARLPAQPRPRRLSDGAGRAWRAMAGTAVGSAALRLRRLRPVRRRPDRPAAGAPAVSIAAGARSSV
jgi:SMODS and SLOG-associating 2TM effector domain family 5